jgi:hypothetical protein
MSENYDLRRQGRLLRKLDKALARLRRSLVARYGEARAGTLVDAARDEYRALLPQIPFIGEGNPFLIFLLPTSRYLAIHRALRREGRPVEETGQLIYELNQAELRALPVLIRRMIGWLWFTRWFGRRLERRAAESQVRRHPGGFVFQYVQGDGERFDFGIDYRECANVKFLRDQGAPELTPFVCAVDKVASEQLGWGLTRTSTLAAGCEHCDFRFKKGGVTRVEVPESLRSVAGPPSSPVES